MSAESGESSRVPYVDYGYGSHVGLRRELNEDSFVVTDRLFAVADGMGGHEAGEVASSLAVQALAEGWEAHAGQVGEHEIGQFLDDADERIRSATDSKAGTTLSGAVVVEADDGNTSEDTSGQWQWLVFNIGDSRTYLLSDGALIRLTRDHSQVQELVDSGMITAEEMHSHPNRNVITRALGAGDMWGADFSKATVQPGQRLLVCSDGLTGELTDDDISQILNAGRNVQDTVDWLIHQALRQGGRDNVTVVLVDVKDH
ncbi:PP2C family protein-serine/threonine phosphatase [Nesterenkonia natronophila]|uniref:Serine/threonine-protein phosphatase n=1 Tax=Nesterenkonia natronophila TaxID=2174932 RepID=A0A3A4FAD0_9MICC|nr:protein phosphatase 2C domain-containing protein [Nesterenkonia natronophila]RJN31754.1 serine/threonine-protein phosphatase [Nesterenkonia natronophila]